VSLRVRDSPVPFPHASVYDKYQAVFTGNLSNLIPFFEDFLVLFHLLLLMYEGYIPKNPPFDEPTVRGEL
jgi:hypothetical protein